MNRTTSLLAICTSLLAACGGSQGTHPDDMSAEEHRQAAAEEDSEAAAHESEYDPNRAAQTTAQADMVFGLGDYNPTAGHLAIASEHEELAAEHRAAAAALETFEEEQCARFPPESRAACPLLGQVESIEDVDGGVRLSLAEGVNEPAMVEHLRCHLAFARAQGREGMDHCPLYVSGAQVRTDSGVTLTTDAGDEAVTELRRRARAHTPSE